MSGINFTIQSALSGLRAAQAGIDVVSRAQFKITDLEFEIRCCEEP